ncbi:hypothetical protein N7520_006160 [Penicillium odoratum]|uniref:uncharacterized protein n=1 Tax=Penicillium odoratum TaxID=1167516 RepID=UPI0025487F90|nr:uncharacterized protein N7520_006160 [Penicillium odoratum]KAJ5759004.1 hypothetical protein N7520_006160 [Penicillium odoratum]
MPITEEVLEATTLGRAINKASDKTVRAVLNSICAKNDEARKEAESQLLVFTDSEEGSVNVKISVPRYALCFNCGEKFDVTANTNKSCQYHTEKSEPTGEDLYVDNYGEFDVEEMRDDWPECFTFACCDGNLRDNPDGCVFNFHQEPHANSKPSKRARVY